jgi:hypothetical protein
MADKTKMIETDKIIAFKGGYLSQWHIQDFKIDDITFNCCEQYMMYCKAEYFEDEEKMKEILEEKIPKEQKKIGRNVKNFDDDEWLKVADEIVFKANYAKFSQNEDLKAKLLATKDKIIVEASPYDARWGNGLNIEDTIATPIEEWKGENRLGKAIMNVREELRSQTLRYDI